MNINNENAKLIKGIYPLTPLQEGMLYHSLAEKESSSYVLQSVYKIEKLVNEDYLHKALALLERRYDVLRTLFIYEKISEPRQIVLRQREIEYEKIDLSKQSKGEQEAQLTDILKADVQRGFDLQKDTLLRVKYIALGDGEHRLVWSMHHIIVDGWCMAIIFSDFMAYYKGLKDGMTMEEMAEGIDLRKSEVLEYGAYIHWIGKQDEEEALTYWENLLYGYEGVAKIEPMIKPRAVEKQVEENSISIQGKVSKDLFRMAKDNFVTINNVLEAAWGILLQRYNSKNDVVFGKVVSGRNAQIQGIDKIVGLFINTIPFRVSCEEDITVDTLIKDLGRQGVKSNSYDHCSLAKIQSKTSQKSALIQSLFIFENYYKDEKIHNNNIGGLEATLESSREQTNYPITLYAFVENEKIEYKLLYNPNEYEEKEIEMILRRLEKILCQMAKNPKIKVSEIDILAEGEKELVVSEFNDTRVDYDREKTIVDLFEFQVEQRPDAIAVIFEEHQMTYKVMNQKANKVARKLRELGVKPNDFVALMSKRSFELIIGIYGILKAGGAYVPIDPTYPEERIKYMIKDCDPKAILVYKENFGIEVEGMKVIDFEDEKVLEGLQDSNLEKVNTSKDLAYCIYTSGTTGNPKGTMLKHSNVHNYCLYNEHNVYGKAIKERHTRIVSVTTLSFDIFVTEAILPIVHGKTMVLTNEEEQNSQEYLSNLIERYDVEVIQTTPSKFKMYMMNGEALDFLKKLRVIILGGEKVPSSLCDGIRRYTDAKIYDVYGPTETTVWSTIYEVDRALEDLPIGKPLANTQIYIQNEGRLCGIGILGELCIAGDGVASGYFNRLALTEERFIENPYGEGELYRTGDLAKWLPDGNIAFRGRIDEQVKIRGFRIELGEIESVIRKLDRVKDVAVVAREKVIGDKHICAYIVSSGNDEINRIRDAIGKILPEHMQPTYMTFIEEIPVTKNGKLDKGALPEIEAKSERGYTAPRNELEYAICRVFSKVLNTDRVGIDDGFFELGGHSLLAIRLEVEMAKEQWTFSVAKLLKYRTVREIANYLKGEEASAIAVEEKVENKEEETKRDCGVKLENIEPFNDVFYKGCLYNAQFPALIYYNKNIFSLLINDAIRYVYHENMDAINIEYLASNPVENIFENEGISVCVKNICENVGGSIIKSIEKQRPVAVQIDSFYSPLRMDTYKKIHWRHFMLIYGFDKHLQEFHVIEHSHRDNLTYTKKTMNFQDLERAYWGGIEEFGSSQGTYYEYIDVGESKSNKIPKALLKELEQETMVQTIHCKKDALAEGLSMLGKFSEIYLEAITDQEVFKEKVMVYVDALNHIINGKEVEKYRIKYVFGIETPYYEKVDEITKLWQRFRMYLAKYMYSGIFEKESLQLGYEYMQHIIEGEKAYIKLFI